MGCSPSNNKKEEIIACVPQQQQEEKVMNKDDFKIREGLMVQETKGDPHYYTMKFVFWGKELLEKL